MRNVPHSELISGTLCRTVNTSFWDELNQTWRCFFKSNLLPSYIQTWEMEKRIDIDL